MISISVVFGMVNVLKMYIFVELLFLFVLIKACSSYEIFGLLDEIEVNR